MSLNYLQKKNWHQGSLKNQEIVWIREQIQADIINREQERDKKLAEEKNIEELKRIQQDVSKLEKQHQNSAEEYLLGNTATSQEIEKLADQREKIKKTQQYQTVFKLKTTNAKCEDFEQSIKQVLLQNPLKVRQLQEKIEANTIIKKENTQRQKGQKVIKKNSSSSSSTTKEHEIFTAISTGSSHSLIYQQYLKKDQEILQQLMNMEM